MRSLAWRVSTGAFLLLAGAFAIASLYVIFRQAIYVPYWDHWGWVDRYLAGTETIAALIFTPNNGHVVAVPGLLYWSDLALFGASNRVGLIAMIACIAGVCLLLRARFSALADAFRGRTTEMYFAATAVLMLWFHNWENLFWPFQVHEYLAVLFSVAAVFALSASAADAGPRALRARAVAAVVLGVLAGMSFGPGLGVWGPLLAIVWLGRWRAGAKWGATAVIVAIAALWLVYLLSWVAHESHPIGILRSLQFLALYLGSPFFHGYNERVLTDPARLTLPLYVGYAALALACAIAARYLRLRRQRPLSASELFFGGVMLFALAAGAMAAVVRGGGGLPSPALSSRYGVLCLLFWVSAVPLAVAGFGAALARLRLLETAVPIVLLALLVRSQAAYLGWWLNWRSMVEGSEASLVSAVPDPDYLGYVLHRPDMVERVTGALLERMLSPLHEERARVIGHPLAEFGAIEERCWARVGETKRLPAGYRFSGTVLAAGLPFDELPVYVTDDAGRVIGIGNVDRGWWQGVRGGLAGDYLRSWRAFAPVGESALRSVHVYASTGRGLCTVARSNGPALAPD